MTRRAPHPPRARAPGPGAQCRCAALGSASLARPGAAAPAQAAGRPARRSERRGACSRRDARRKARDASGRRTTGAAVLVAAGPARGGSDRRGPCWARTVLAGGMTGAVKLRRRRLGRGTSSVSDVSAAEPAVSPIGGGSLAGAISSGLCVERPTADRRSRSAAAVVDAGCCYRTSRQRRCSRAKRRHRRFWLAGARRCIASALPDHG